MALHVAVIGAGAFGGWTALHLLRSGSRVTLIDAWGPGNSRSSSGDETRVIRGSYGPNAVYTEMVARSIPMWKENERRWRLKLLHQCGVLWTAAKEDSYEKASLEQLRRIGMPVDALKHDEGKRRFPQMNWDGIEWAIYERDSGYLMARRGCQAVMEGFQAENGTYRQSAARWNGKHVELDRGERVEADTVVFACGPWLAKLFPDVLGSVLTPTRQEIFYFGTPQGDTSFNDDRFPAWADNTADRFYGIPGNQWRGFKIAKDVPGPVFDPTSGDRVVSAEGLAEAKKYAAMRFPALAGAPLLESRVCQYEMSADGGLIIDRLPGASNVWIAGGGSGHSYKFAPALGEYVSELVRGKARPREQFLLARFADAKPGAIGERK